MKIKQLIVGSLYSNCYVLYNDSSDKQKNQAVIIDPGDDSDKIIEFLNHKNLVLSSVLLTHGHFDHTGGLASIEKVFGSDNIYMNKKDVEFYENQKDFLNLYNFRTVEIKNDLRAGDKIMFANKFLEIIETPGHSQGSVSIINREDKVIFSGDLIFKMSIGRTDLPGGDSEKMKESLAKIVDNFPGYTIYPGHGESTTIDFEKEHNPFLVDL